MNSPSRYALALLLLAVAVPGAEAATQRTAAQAGTGWLGVTVTELRRTSSGDDGARFESRFLIDAVEPNSGAALAGLRAGDEVLGLNGRAFTMHGIRGLAETLLPGQTVRLEVERGSSVQTLEVRAGPRPANRPGSTPVLATRVFPSAPNPDDPRPDWVRDPAETREFTILFRTSEDRSQGWSYSFEPESSAMDFDVYALRNSELDSTVVSLERLTEDMDALRIERLAGMRGERRIVADPAPVPFEMQSRLLELRDRMAVISLRSIPGGAPSDTVFRVRVPRARAITPYLSVGSYLLGARIQNMDASLAGYFGVEEGVLVADVAAGTPAAQAGLLAGDVIVELNGRNVGTTQDLQDVVSTTHGRMRLEVVRRGTRVDLEISQ